MALIIGCDICARFVKTVPWEKRSEIQKQIVCSDCERKIKTLDSYIEKIKSKTDHQLNQIYEAAKKELKDMIANLAAENNKE